MYICINSNRKVREEDWEVDEGWRVGGLLQATNETGPTPASGAK